MGCTVSVQIHPDTTIKEDLPEVDEPNDTKIPLVRKDSSDSYILI